MVYVPAGPFLMGTDDTDADNLALEQGFPTPWYVDEHPLHRVKLPAFYIDKFEVTNERYLEFVKAANRAAPDHWVQGRVPDGKARLPVVYVNWYDAEAYCKWAGKRLPTEAEWEKAARGSEGLNYPWGTTFDPSRASIAGAAVMLTGPVEVGRYETGKSPYGAYDMIGNVWEWTDSWYMPYPGNGYKSEYFGQNLKVNRGVSFMSVGHFGGEDYQKVSSIVARAAFRSYDLPLSRMADIGFRCAK